MTAPSSFGISRATPADAAALRDLHVRTWADTYAGLLPPDYYEHRLALHRTRDWDKMILDQEAEGGGILVARSDTTLAGLCQYGPTENEDDPPEAVGHIHRLYVHPASQGQGIGRSLLTAAVDRLTNHGVSSLTLWALENDPRARGFYEHLGWSLDGARRDDGGIDVRYRRTLS